jgi:enamine deaminase RidA (YjgF/YER057c/UK114 family)
MSVEEKLAAMGLTLGEAPKPVAAYIPGILAGDMLYISGQLPLAAGKLLYTGLVGKDVTAEEGYLAAKQCALNGLSVVKSLLGDLDRIEQIVKVTGFVASAAGFNGQPQVINGASELFGTLLEKSGLHARSAVGVAELPLNAPVEVEFIIKVKESQA